MTTKNKIEVVMVKDSEEGGKKAFDIVKGELENGLKVLGLATGSSPEPMYAQMRACDLDFSDVVAINLDEYISLSPDHPQSYSYFMHEQLFDHKEFKATYLPDGLAPAETEIPRYDKILNDNPIDLQIVGIGVNGHLGFNEPGTPFDSDTVKVELTDETIEANKRFFGSAEEVPRTAYSMGLGSIMAAKKIVLLAYGESKADAIANALNGPISEDVPASILRTHPDITFILDEGAASKL